jgi:hypothetical protein
MSSCSKVVRTQPESTSPAFSVGWYTEFHLNALSELGNKTGRTHRAVAHTMRSWYK